MVLRFSLYLSPKIKVPDRVELAFSTGQFWFDQLHRFNIRVNTPGSTLTLTLRAALTQNINDESGGFDNITITAFPLIVPPNLTAANRRRRI